MIPLRDENPSYTTPIVTRALIIVNALVFMFELWLGPELRGFMFERAFIPQRLTIALQGGSEPLFPALGTLLSSMFLHGGWLHLIGNMWYLWIFGDNIEDRFGHLRFLLFYLLAGVLSAIMHWVFHAGSAVPTVGASGAIAGVLGAYAMAFPRARVVTLVPIVFFFQIVAMPALIVLGLWFLMQFFSGALSLGYATGGGVAWWAHIGGFMFGFLSMRVFDRGAPRRSEAWIVDR